MGRKAKNATAGKPAKPATAKALVMDSAMADLVSRLSATLPATALEALVNALTGGSAPAVPAVPAVKAKTEKAEKPTTEILKGLVVNTKPAVFVPQPKTNLIEKNSQLGSKEVLVEMVCHSIGRLGRGGYPVIFVEPESLTPFCIFMGDKTIESKGISTGGKYGVSGTITGHSRMYDGFQSNYLGRWEIQKIED